jgi:hypothetical protein
MKESYDRTRGVNSSAYTVLSIILLLLIVLTGNFYFEYLQCRAPFGLSENAGAQPILASNAAVVKSDVTEKLHVRNVSLMG